MSGSREQEKRSQGFSMAAVAGSEEEMTRELAYALSAMCQEASRLYGECFEKADQSEKARAVSQGGYLDGVQQHPISRQHFADMASRLEGEMTSLLHELRDLSAKGQSVWSDFMFLAGGPSSDFSAAMLWCSQHGIGSDTVTGIAVDGLYLRSDFGLTKASLFEMSDRLRAVLESSQQ